VPAKLYDEIFDRIEILGFTTVREYIRHVIHNDLKKMRDEMKK